MATIKIIKHHTHVRLGCGKREREENMLLCGAPKKKGKQQLTNIQTDCVEATTTLDENISVALLHENENCARDSAL